MLVMFTDVALTESTLLLFLFLRFCFKAHPTTLFAWPYWQDIGNYVRDCMRSSVFAFRQTLKGTNLGL